MLLGVRFAVCVWRVGRSRRLRLIGGGFRVVGRWGRFLCN
jgi:hypothetical protein